MFTPRLIPRLLVAGLLAAIAAASLAAVAAAGPQAPVVPTDIKVEDGHKVFLVGHAVGVQIYTCNGTSWGSSTPRADLYDDHGKVIVTHFGGPSWQAKDGSKVVAARAGGVSVDPTAIPWLVLRVTSRSVGPDGGDRLYATTFIQRVATTGGLPPAAADCNAASAGTVAEVPYTADYYFWKKQG
jgi:uncharacterized protein DUF3455